MKPLLSRALSVSGWSRATVSMGGVNLVSMGLDFLVLMLIARLLGPTTFGQFALAQAAIGLAAASIARASTTSVVKCFSAAERRGRPSTAAFWSFTLCAALLAASLSVVSAWWMGAGGRLETGSLATPALLFLLVATAGFLTVASTSLSALNWTVQPPVLAHLPNSIVRPLGLLGASLLYFAMWGAKLDTALAALATAQLASLLGSLVTRPSRERRQEVPGEGNAAPLWRSLAAVLVAFALTNAAGLVEIVLLGFYGRQADVGLFKIALSFTVFVNLGAVVSGLVYSPKIAKAFAAKSAEAAALTALSARMTFVFAFLAGAAILAFAPFVLPWVLGPGYAGALPLLVAVVFATMVAAVGGAGSNILNMSGETRTLNRLLAVTLLVKLALGLVLIPRIGVWGAVLSYAIGLLLLRFFVVMSLKRITGAFETSVEDLP